jgi:Zn-dependent protease with chaperone function
MNLPLKFNSLAASFLFLLLCSSPAHADRTKLRPGINSFSTQQDIQVGRQAASQARQKLPMCNDPKVDAYLTKIGMRLVDHLNTNGVEYPWEFHCVNDKAVNAFALPGGFVFINRGVIEAADNEAQLAAVMAHELSHVALRHGTNQATKARYAQLGSGILGAAGSIFGGATGALAAGAGQLAAGSVLLKYSRAAETQADIMGTQVLYDSGYDPRAMAAFFEKLGVDDKSKAPPEFFSDHPNPDHRIERVDEEISKLGGSPEEGMRDTPEFESIKREVLALPVVAKPTPGAATANKGPALPPPGAIKVGPPSTSLASLKLQSLTLKYPDNWNKYGKDNEVTLAPDGGIVDAGNGQAALAYGVMVGVAGLEGNAPSGSDALKAVTQKLIEQIHQENADMQVTRPPRSVTLNGQPAMSTYLTNDSPAGGRETDWLITVLRPEGVVYLVCVAPEADYEQFERAFANLLDSVRFSN